MPVLTRSSSRLATSSASASASASTSVSPTRRTEHSAEPRRSLRIASRKHEAQIRVGMPLYDSSTSCPKDYEYKALKYLIDTANKPKSTIEQRKITAAAVFTFITNNRVLLRTYSQLRETVYSKLHALSKQLDESPHTVNTDKARKAFSMAKQTIESM